MNRSFLAALANLGVDRVEAAVIALLMFVCCLVEQSELILILVAGDLLMQMYMLERFSPLRRISCYLCRTTTYGCNDEAAMRRFVKQWTLGWVLIAAVLEAGGHHFAAGLIVSVLFVNTLAGSAGIRCLWCGLYQWCKAHRVEIRAL